MSEVHRVNKPSLRAQDDVSPRRLPNSQSREVGRGGHVVWNGCYPSDQCPLVDEHGNGFSLAFIPGRLSDHDLLDDKYVYRLRMMSGSLSAAMEQCCWCELQGAYFAN
jgi:hypothetical protein